MTDADIDRLQKRVDSLCREIDNAVARKARHRVTVEHFDDNGDDDGDYGDGDSNPSLASSEADDDENGNGDNPGNDVDDDDDDDEDEEDNVAKLGGPPRYQRETTGGHQQSNDETNRPGALKTSRHKFVGRVDFVKARDGVSRSEAMSRARNEYPDDYAAYQRLGKSTNNISKYAPSTFDQMVEQEMAKGCNREIAGQRVAQLHGFRAFDNGSRTVKRRGDLIYEFQKRVDEIMYKDGVDATEATRRARMEDPRLFRAMQRAG
jgi:hypothetical protein